jgi:hypothetical protein
MPSMPTSGPAARRIVFPADRRSTHTFQLLADPLLYLTITRSSEMPFGHSSAIAFFGHGLVPLRPWRELTLNRGRRWGSGAR